MSSVTRALCGAIADIFPDATFRQVEEVVRSLLNELEDGASNICYPYLTNFDSSHQQEIFEGAIRNLKGEL